MNGFQPFQITVRRTTNVVRKNATLKKTNHETIVSVSTQFNNIPF
jgi:hypothetical protein